MGRIQKLLSCLLLLSLFHFCASVDRSKFRTCDQASFCKKNRNLNVGDSKHFLDSSASRLDQGAYSGRISNSVSQENLKVDIVYYGDSIIRVQIREENGLRARYEVKDVLLPLEKQPADGISQNEAATNVSFSGSSVIIQHNPLRFDFYKGNSLSVTANSRGLFNFEHYRTKPNAPAEAQPADQSGDQVEGVQEEPKQEPVVQVPTDSGDWEEHFGSHRDSKPFGPSSIGLDFAFVGSEHVYGIPEHASSFALKPTKGISDPYRLYNLDVFEYELDVPMSLYGAVPLLISHDAQKTVGIFWLNPSETWIDISSSASESGVPQTESHWISETGLLDFFVLLGPTPADLFRQYAHLTGTQALPPLFSIAYHQCRWNYKSEADVLDVDANFDQHDIPYDVIWLDIEHTDSKKYFTWDGHHFPTPEKMQEAIAFKQRKMVTIIDPHIKRDGGYAIHTEAQAKGYYIKNSGGGEYEGWCWPGSSSWLDFLNPEIRQWWASKFTYENYKGSTSILYTWNDMNEPSVFNGPEVTMHKDAKHFGDLEHREVHNLYGFYMHMATSQGLELRNSNKDRPFVLSRAFFAGSQRYGAIWTGDNAAEWSHLQIAQPMLLSLGVSGIAFSGADVGGFFGNPDGELMTRWMQAGAFHPFFRGHAHLDTKRREPYLFGEPFTTHIRNAIRTRYQLLPFWYTLFYQNTLSGLPIIRPLWVEFPQDKLTFALQDQYLVGNALLVKPVVSQGQASTTVYLPGDQPWYAYQSHHVFTASQTITVKTPLDKIPVFQRGGTIITKKERARRSSSLMSKDPYTLVVALDNQLRAEGDLYVDDGYSYEFKNGQYLYRKFTFSDNILQSSKIGTTLQSFSPENTIERIVIRGYLQKPTKVVLEHQSHQQDISFDYNTDTQTLTLRKPLCLIKEDWHISIN